MGLLLIHRAFARFWVAGLCFMLAWWALHAVMLIQVFALTGSPFATGLIPVFSSLPGIVFGPVAGVLVDRWSRPRVMTTGALVLAVMMFSAIPLANQAGVGLLFAIILLQSLVMTFYSPAENALLPNLVPADSLRTANALNALNDSIGRIVGPSVGAGLLVAFGFRTTLVVVAVLYLLGWIVLLGLRAEVRKGDRSSGREASLEVRSVLRSVIESFGLLRTNLTLVLAVMVGALYMVADVPLSAVLPAFMQDSVGVSAELFGQLMSVRGLTGLAGGLLVVWLSRRVDEGWLLVGGLALYGCSIATMGISNAMPMAALVLIPIGPASAATETGLITTLQRASSDAIRGRVFALSRTINEIITLVVSLAAGVIATGVGTQAVVIASGCLQVLPLLVALVILRRRTHGG